MGKVFIIFFTLINYTLKQQRLQQIRVALLLAGVLLFTAGNTLAVSVTTSGEFEEGTSKEVHFSLSQETVVSLNLTLGCKDENNTTMGLYSDNYVERIGARFSQSVDVQPWHPLPLAAGNWKVKFYCNHEYLTDGTPTPYTLTYSKDNLSSVYSKDSESHPVSTPSSPITLTKGQMYSGWMGFVGYKPVALDPYYVYKFGEDGSDCYYFNLKAGTKIKVRLDYDIGLNDKLYDNDIAFDILPKDSAGPYVLFEYWQKSGDISKEITIPKDATYVFRVKGMRHFGSGHSFTNFPKEKYGGYRMSVIVNGDDPLPSIGIGLAIITTTYRDPVSREYVTVNLLVPGETSLLRIPVSSSKYQQIRLVVGFSLKNGSTYGPIKPIGLGTCKAFSGYNLCRIDATLDKNIKGIRGKLVIVGYTDGPNVTQQQTVSIYDENSLIVIGPTLNLLLGD